MAGMGPPPKPEGSRARRNATVSMTRLPAKGFDGPIPSWPLRADVVLAAKRKVAAAKVERLEYDLTECAGDKRAKVERQLDPAMERLAVLDAQMEAQAECEQDLWASLWRTPQAAAWNQLGWHRMVALYVRWQILAENGALDAGKEARQYEDRLGLNPLAMLRLRWAVADDEVSEQRSGPTGGAPSSRSRYGNLRAVSE